MLMVMKMILTDNNIGRTAPLVIMAHAIPFNLKT